MAGRNDLPLLHAGDLADEMLTAAAAQALAKVAEHRATFTRGNVFAEVLRVIHGVRFADPGDRELVADRVTTMALDRAVMLTPPEIGRTHPGVAAARGRDAASSGPAAARCTPPRSSSTPKTGSSQAGRTTSGPAVTHALARQATAGAAVPGAEHRAVSPNSRRPSPQS